LRALLPALLCLACLASIPAQDPDPKAVASRPTKAVESVFGLEIPLPEGWTRDDDPGGTVMFVPPRRKEAPLEPPLYFLIVLPPQPLRGTLWETQLSIFNEVKALLKDPIEPKHEPSVPGPFIRTSTVGKDATNWTQVLRLNGVLTEAGYVGLAVYGSEDLRTIGTILHGVVVKNPPKAASRPRIAEAWRRLAQQSVAEYHRGQQLITAVPYDRLWLRSDGVADFTPLYLEGHAASPLPPKIDAKMLQGFYGAWTAVGDHEVHVTRAADKPAQVYRRENGKLRLGDQVWEPMASVDGLKLEGRWHLPGAAQPRRIEFTAAGRFKDDGLLEDVGYLPVPAWAGGHVVRLPCPPARGEGRYEIREFTILFTYDDGFTWSADFSIEGNDPKDLSKLLMRAGTLHRER
jgi:hypothetical protein